MNKHCIAAFALSAAFIFVPTAPADSWGFTFDGGGIHASGVLNVSPGSTAGADEITGISGAFSDTNVGVSGAITGLYQPVSYVTNTLASPGIAFTTAGLSYDDTFYPGGNSPAICNDLNPVTGKPELSYPFSGGVLDIFGVTFTVAGSGGYVGELWSNGDVNNGPIEYAAGLANGTKLLDDPNAGADSTVPPGRYGSLSVSAVPEPSSLTLFGVALLAIIALVSSKIRRLRRTEMFRQLTNKPHNTN